MKISEILEQLLDGKKLYHPDSKNGSKLIYLTDDEIDSDDWEILED